MRRTALVREEEEARRRATAQRTHVELAAQHELDARQWEARRAENMQARGDARAEEDAARVRVEEAMHRVSVQSEAEGEAKTRGLAVELAHERHAAQLELRRAIEMEERRALGEAAALRRRRTETAAGGGVPAEEPVPTRAAAAPQFPGWNVSARRFCFIRPAQC